MLTDDQARDLLRQAAATVEVLPAAPLVPVPRRPRWPLLVAAASVVGIVAGGALLGLGRTDPEPVAPVPSLAKVVPSVFGLTVDQARDRLERSGLTVTDRPRVVCEVDRQALETVPHTGQPVPAYGAVTLNWADSSSIDCPGISERTAAWDFLGFLAGQRPAPRFAATVSITSDARGAAPIILDRGQQQDPTRWAGLMADVLAVMAADDVTMSVYGGNPGRLPYACAGRTQPSVGELRIAVSRSHEPTTCAVEVTLRRTNAGVITSVSVTRGRFLGECATCTPRPTPEG